MSDRLVYPYSDSLLHYEFMENHPLKPERLKLTYELSKMFGLIDKVDLIEPVLATSEELEMFHSTEYLDAVIRAGKSQELSIRHGLGVADNPVFPGIFDAAARYVGATLEAAKRIVRGATTAFCISGGMHHAHRSEASGFCIFNDPVLAIMHIQKKKPSRVLYFDFDAHHSDGVQNAFYRSKDVLTISIHQTGKTLFPGSGFTYESGGGDGIGYSVNVPVIPGAGSTELIRIFDEVVVPLFESYKPDLLVTQMGVDGHYMDPLAHLSYTTYGYETIIKRLKDLTSNICKTGWLALGGGGYHPINVARIWTLFLALLLDEDIPQEFPEEFVAMAESMGYSTFPEGIRDEAEVVQQYFSRDEVALDLDRQIRKIEELVFPYHGL